MKKCNKCKSFKSVVEFAKNKCRKDGLQVQCRKCKKESDAKHYQENKEAQRHRNRCNRRKVLDEVNSYKKLKGCFFCSESEPCCLDFHHKLGTIKEGNVSRIVIDGSKADVWKEIEKCEVLCSNCHRKLHAGILKFKVVPIA